MESEEDTEEFFPPPREYIEEAYADAPVEAAPASEPEDIYAPPEAAPFERQY